MLSGKTVLITGATSGIGEATAEACASEGARVVISGRNTTAGEELISRLHGSGHLFVAADLRIKSQAQTLVTTVLQKVGTLDVPVNSAGVMHHQTVADTSDEQWDDTIAVNLNAVFYLCRSAIPAMVRQGGGVIVNVASTWGLVAAESSAAYCASKGAVIQLTRAIAMDHARDNVRINAVCPGSVDTPMLESAANSFGISADQGRELWAADSATKTIASAQDIADAIIFLASDKAKHIHGVALPVDGGSLAG
jgi:meso-butanediol dehydrogenase/(S,S)-butanediol dehydrogenase/diacetyl reductase